MEQKAFKAVINLVEVSQLVDLTDLLEHRVVDECMSLFNSNVIFRKTQKSKIIQKMTMNTVEIQGAYIALVDMGMVWRLATPSAEDRQTYDCMPYKWSNYAHKVSSIILARHSEAHRIICVNDPYDFPHSTKEDERDLRRHGNPFVPNHYMKLDDPFPSDKAFKLLLAHQQPGPRFNKKMTSYQYRKSHCGDKTILRPSYLHNGISYTGKMTSLYWIRALENCISKGSRNWSVAMIWYLKNYQPILCNCGDKTIFRPSYLHNGISYTGKMTSLYWIRALENCISKGSRNWSVAMIWYLKNYQPILCSCIASLAVMQILDSMGRGKSWFTNRLIRVKRRGDYSCIVGTV